MANLNGIVRGDVSNVASETINENTMYDLQDLQPISITNTQMTNALTNAKFYKKDSVWFCIDSGTYTQNHFYKFTVTNPYTASVAYSWTDLGGISDSIQLKTINSLSLTGSGDILTGDLSFDQIQFPTAPTQPTISGNNLTFTEVSGATSYSVMATDSTTGTEYDLGEVSA